MRFGNFCACFFPMALLCNSGCMTNPETGRKELSLVSSSEEMQLGLASFDKMKKELPVSHDPAANAIVQKVGRQIASVAKLPNAQWEFVVFESKEANAFCLPGGKVGVYTGILPITRDESGLATVLGHEVAHAVSHHGKERMSEAMALQLGGDLVDKAAGAYAPKYEQMATVIYGAGAQVGRALPHSRKQESEADHIGVLYMARAGYDPQEAVHFWQRFADFNRQSNRGGNTLWFLQTHPVDEVRIKQLQDWMPDAQREYRGPAHSPGSQISGR